MNARRARRRRRESIVTVVPVANLREALLDSPWRPPTGAGVEFGHVQGVRAVSIICPHQVLVDRKLGDGLAVWASLHPECPVEWIRLYCEPPRALVEAFAAVSLKPNAPGWIAAGIESIHTIAGMISAYLDANPPEACGCDPGIELVFRLGKPDPAVLKTCHEEGCTFVGRRPVGAFGFMATAGRPS